MSYWQDLSYYCHRDCCYYCYRGYRRRMRN